MGDSLVNSEANSIRIANVENCFGIAGQPLSIPGRVLIGEGVLTKMCRKKNKPRQFYLFNDILVYGNIIIHKKKLNKQHIIPLEEVKLLERENDGQIRNGWTIQSRGKSFVVCAATAQEKRDWMNHISKCISDLLQKSGKSASDEHAAVWVPDSEANTCMVCAKQQFSLVNRRHHCRKCGSVVCGGCSSHKFHLPSQSSKPLRVCNPCYDQATQAAQERVNISRESKVTESSGEEDSDEETEASIAASDEEGQNMERPYWFTGDLPDISGNAKEDNEEPKVDDEVESVKSNGENPINQIS